VPPEVALVLSHQYLDFQTPLYILAQIQSAIINQQTEKRKQIKLKIRLK
jgi:hypothetical protein